VGVILVSTDDPTHGDFALRLARRLLWMVVAGYVLMLVTGMWMGHVENLLDSHWAEMAMNIWGVGALFIGLAVRSVTRQIRSRGGREAVLGRLFMAGWGAVLVVILYFMVFKPG
jgi:hypothetical protein